jgi:dTDP-4-dehydrorhamnose 3,5-epimerase
MMKMLPGLKIIKHIKHGDARGSFYETWKMPDDMRGTFRQLNTATSTQNVIRGLHRQNQYKCVMPVFGRIFDVAVNPETNEWFGIELDDSTGLLIPPQYAHGYLVLSETAIVQYIVDAPYNKAEEENFKWNQYNIEWPFDGTPLLSEKDS